MIVYQSGKKDFIQATRKGDIDETIVDLFKIKTKRGVSASEKRSWSSSLLHVANVLDSQDLDDDIEVGVEIFLPPLQKRIDVAVAGRDSNDHKRIVVIELKQWESAKSSDLDGMPIVKK